MTAADALKVDPALIRRVASGQGLTLPPPVATALASFGDLFLLWNSRINLGGRISPAELVEKHFLDAFAAARFVPPGVLVAEVGSGGGLPLIPLALVRDQARFEAWEPTAKKVAFLRTAVRELGLGGRIAIHPERLASPVPAALRGRFEVASSRATFPPGEWRALGRQMVTPGGRVIVFATDEAPQGCPEPESVHAYGVSRRLLVFGAAQPL